MSVGNTWRAATWLIVWATAHSLAGAAENWPQFRGADSLGVVENPNLPDTWSETENVAWKCELPGRGWSSPVVWNGRVFVTTVVNQNPQEQEQRGVKRKGLYLGGGSRSPSKSVHEWKVIALDLADGRILWEQTPHTGAPTETIHAKNSYASETPVTDGKRLYVYFGNVGVFCFDLDGKPLWKHEFEPAKTANGWGTGASPTLYKDRLYILNDNEEQSYLAALDVETGREIWRVKRDERSGWSTPYIWQNDLRTEIICSGSDVVRSYDLDGNPLWQLGEMSDNAIPSPFARDGLLYVCSGYFMGQKKPIVAIKPGAAGDITPKDDDGEHPFIAWRQKRAAPYNPSILLYKDQIYVLRDVPIFGSYDAKTGQEVYEKKRLEGAQAFTASPWACNDKVFCLNEYGVTFVIAAGKQFELLGKNSLAEDDMCLATPAIAGDTLLIRSDRRLYAIRKAAPGAQRE